MSTAAVKTARAVELDLPAPRLADAAADWPGRELDAPAPAASRGFFYGWLMVPLATAVMIASAPGQTYGFMFFNPAIRRSLSLSQTEMSATYLLATLLAAVPLSYLGALSDRYGLKRSLLAAVLAMAASCLLASAAHSAAVLFVACLGLRMIGAGVMSLYATNTLAVWFDRRLGLAASIMQFAMAWSMAVVPLALISLIDLVGWRGAYVLLAAGLAGGLWPLVALFYREHPRDVGQRVDGERGEGRADRIGLAADGAGRRLLRIVSDDEPPSLNLSEAARTTVFWLLIVATAVWSLIGTGLMFHLESLLGACRLSRDEAAWATPLMAAAMAAMQLFSGALVDRFPLRRLIAAALACVTASCLILAGATGSAALTAYFIYGAGQGLMTVVSSASWARYFGPAHLGRIRGTAMTVGIASSAIGPLVMGASVDWLGGFEPSLWLFAGVAIVVASLGNLVE